MVLSVAAGALVTAVVVLLIRLYPVHPLELAGFGVFIMVPFVAAGLLVGTLLKRRQTAIPLALGAALPLFFASGPFGPPVYPPGGRSWPPSSLPSAAVGRSVAAT